MTDHWDEFSKSLAKESLPRRESLRRLGVVFAGAVLSPLGLATALARGADPCKAFCNGCAKSQRSRCLTACRACHDDPGRLCGTCGSYVCCGSGRTCCSGYCTDLAGDVLNCGECGFVCDPPGPYEYGACIGGGCAYVCADGAVYCDGTCTFLDADPGNCGACGNVCPESTPYCNSGSCGECPAGFTLCGGECVDLSNDPRNCGDCGNVCAGGHVCSFAVCCDPLTQACGSPCAPGLTLCGDTCVNLFTDFFNCGACGHSCVGSGEYCANGSCENYCNPCGE